MMRRKYRYIILLASALLLAVQTLSAKTQEADSVVAPHTFEIFNQARGYSDRIVIRWMPDEYVSFQFGAMYGYSLFRVHYDKKNMDIDTLATCIKPLTKEQFFAKYSANDSLAAVALQTVYGKTMGLNQTQAPPGTAGSILEEYEHQQLLFGYGALVADLRLDLAEAMGLAFVDKTAKKGEQYDYILKCLAPEDKCKTSSNIISGASLDTYVQPKMNFQVQDSIINNTSVELTWPETVYSAYDIERREMNPDSKEGSDGGAITPWQRLNERPFISFSVDTGDDNFGTGCHFTDHDVEPGVYEYRIKGYDSFGDKTEPTQPRRVVMLDRVPPTAPVIRLFEILRTDSTINARIEFWKDIVEPDFKGCLVFYNNPKTMGDQWLPIHPIGDDGKPMMLIPPGQNSCIISCRGLETGDIVVAAIDNNNNVSYSSRRQMIIADIKAPDVPTNLRYTTEIKDTLGLVHLVWTAPQDQDIDYYQINTANDTTHMFQPHAFCYGRNDTLYTDTVALDVNQKYIYYKVRAVDFNTHQGRFTQYLQVVRPSLVVPSVARIDTTWQDKQALHIEYVTGLEQQLAYHNVLRRKASEKTWTLLYRCDADSVKLQDNRIRLIDRPAPSKEAYVYAVESYTTSGISSGKSLLYSVRFLGYRDLPCPVKLEGACLENHETRLAWDIISDLPKYDNWYYCIYRKGSGDKNFKFLLSAKKDDFTFSDYLIHDGETAQYYMTLMMPGIAESLPSNTITVKANEKK